MSPWIIQGDISLKESEMQKKRTGRVGKVCQVLQMVGHLLKDDNVELYIIF